MEMKVNKPTVYLSYSLQDSSSKLATVKTALQRAGFNVTHYNKGENYSISKLRDADFVVFIPRNNFLTKQNVHGVTHYEHSVGKGQYTEAVFCRTNNKPAFMYHNSQVDMRGNVQLLVSKLTDEYRGYNHYVLDANSFKIGYGLIWSHSVGPETVDLYNFVTGFIRLDTNIVTVNHVLNRRLLLL